MRVLPKILLVMSCSRRSPLTVDLQAAVGASVACARENANSAAHVSNTSANTGSARAGRPSIRGRDVLIACALLQ